MQKLSLRHVLFFLAGVSLAPAAGCFTGSDASGLPCMEDEQCGVGQTCNDDGYCDQTPDELCGNGILDEFRGEQCDEGAANAEGGACLPDCTLPDPCGNGLPDPDEECDEGDANADNAACKSDCTLQVCGDGFVGIGTELCDEGPDNVDLEALLADNQAEVINEERCTTACERLFYFNGGNDNNSMNKMGPPNPEGFTNAWTAAPVPLSMGNSVWWTGTPPHGAAGVAVMRTPEIDGEELPDDADEEIYLEFRHQWLYPNCTDSPPLFPASSNGDGGNVKLDNFEVGDPPPLEQFSNGDDLDYALEPLGDEGLCMSDPNPLSGQFGYVRQNMGANLPDNWSSASYRIDTKIDLDDGFGVVFEAGFDCNGDCLVDEPILTDKSGWFIDDIIVIGRLPAEG